MIYQFSTHYLSKYRQIPSKSTYAVIHKYTTSRDMKLGDPNIGYEYVKNIKKINNNNKINYRLDLMQILAILHDCVYVYYGKIADTPPRGGFLKLHMIIVNFLQSTNREIGNK